LSASEWRIPRSLMERLSEVEFSRTTAMWNADTTSNMTRSIVGESTQHCQYGFEVPILYFGSMKDRDFALPLPVEIVDQIAGKPATYPMIITWQR